LLLQGQSTLLAIFGDGKRRHSRFGLMKPAECVAEPHCSEQPGMVQVAGMLIVTTALIVANTQLRFRAAALPASPKTSSRSAQTD
jgi:hypothetical protein